MKSTVILIAGLAGGILAASCPAHGVREDHHARTPGVRCNP